MRLSTLLYVVPVVCPLVGCGSKQQAANEVKLLTSVAPRHRALAVNNGGTQSLTLLPGINGAISSTVTVPKGLEHDRSDLFSKVHGFDLSITIDENSSKLRDEFDKWIETYKETKVDLVVPMEEVESGRFHGFLIYEKREHGALLTFDGRFQSNDYNVIFLGVMDKYDHEKAKALEEVMDCILKSFKKV